MNENDWLWQDSEITGNDLERVYLQVLKGDQKILKYAYKEKNIQLHHNFMSPEYDKTSKFHIDFMDFSFQY